MRRHAFNLGVALAALVAAVALRWLLEPALQGTLPLVTLFGAVAVAAWVGGYLPGLLVACFGYLACAALFIEPRSGLGLDSPQNLAGMVAYAFTSLIIVALADTTRRARQRAAERLTATRLLASIVESSDDAIVSKTLDGTIRTWNAGACRLFGYSAEEAVGRHISLIIPPDRLSEEEAILRELCAGRRIEHFDTVRVRRDGSLLDVSLTISPIRDERGHVVGASKIARDIGERKRAEAAFQSQNERLRMLSESATSLLATDDVDAMLQGLVARFGPFLGVDSYSNYLVNDEGDELRLVSSMGVPDEVVSNLRQLAFGQAISGMVALRRQPIYAPRIQQSDDPQAQFAKALGIRACICNPLMSENLLLGTLSFASRSRDQFEPDELNLLATISQYVGIAYERLRLLNKLRDADRRKDEFLATLAHELRNPLAPLRNMLEVMKRSSGDDALVMQARDTMERQLKQLVRLVDDLLDISRISQNRLDLRFDSVDLAAVIQQAVEATRPLLEQSEHQLHISVPNEPFYVRADGVRLTQVLSNLLNNACKYTDPKGTIWLTAEKDGTDAVLSVRDTGVGIAADRLNDVFGMFEQIDPSLERSQGGLGIGLTLVKRIVELHGGTIVAASEGPGHGSRFVVRLPGVVQTATKEQRNSEAPPPHLRRRRVLIVDDNVDSAKSLAMLLEMSGHEVHLAHDGQQAIELAEQIRPDVVLLDIGLPKLNGYDACRHIRQQAWGRDVILVAVTGWGHEDDRNKSRNAGFNHHLVKPVDLGMMMKLMSQDGSAAV